MNEVEKSRIRLSTHSHSYMLFPDFRKAENSIFEVIFIEGFPSKELQRIRGRGQGLMYVQTTPSSTSWPLGL